MLPPNERYWHFKSSMCPPGTDIFLAADMVQRIILNLKLMLGLSLFLHLQVWQVDNQASSQC